MTNAPPNLSPGYARLASTYTRGASMANNTVDSSLGGGQSSTATYSNAFFTVSPELPSGLALDPNTGTISGIPTTSVALATYNVTASNSNPKPNPNGSTSVWIAVLEGVYLDNSTDPISPESGPTTGGTVLMLRTGGSERQWSMPPSCWFGALSGGSGAWVSLEEGTFRCVSPDGASPGAVPLTVSFEGRSGRTEVLKSDGSGNIMMFTYYDDTKQGEGVSYSVKSASMSGTSLDLEWTVDTGDVFCPNVTDLLRLKVNPNLQP